MTSVYVDETVGSDLTGNGTADQPYQTLGFVLFTHGASVRVLTRKDAAGEYEEPTQSALKRAKKAADGLEKKRKKQEDVTSKEAKDKDERRERLLEESKKIVLVEDASLPKATKVLPSVFPH
jgi:asparaginyl-tRNA synthetase